MLDSLKASDHVLSVEEVRSSTVDEDLMFRDLDKAGHICLLGPPISPLRLDLVVALSRNIPELEEHAPSDLSPAETVV